MSSCVQLKTWSEKVTLISPSPPWLQVGWDVWLKAASSRITWTQLTDLIVGSEYRFRIKAENAYGVSDPSGESQQVLIEEAKSTEGCAILSLFPIVIIIIIITH